MKRKGSGVSRTWHLHWPSFGEDNIANDTWKQWKYMLQISQASKSQTQDSIIMLMRELPGSHKNYLPQTCP